MRIYLMALTAAALVCAAAAGATLTSPFSAKAVTGWHYDQLAADENLVFVQSVTGDPAVDTDNTHVVAIEGFPVVHSSGWQTVDLRPYGVPASARFVEVGVKTIITKGSEDGAANVYLFARAPGAACCQGPAGYEQDPLPFNAGQHVRGMIAQSVAQHPGDGVRAFDTAIVPVRGGRLEWDWGYTRNAGVWPAGDGVAVNLYVNGWAG